MSSIEESQCEYNESQELHSCALVLLAFKLLLSPWQLYFYLEKKRWVFKVTLVNQRGTGFPPQAYFQCLKQPSTEAGPLSLLYTENKIVNLGLNTFCWLLGLEKRRKLCQGWLWVHALRVPAQAGEGGSAVVLCRLQRD